jgi:mono/diheme cytochrome c family protein
MMGVVGRFGTGWMLALASAGACGEAGERDIALDGTTDDIATPDTSSMTTAEEDSEGSSVRYDVNPGSGNEPGPGPVVLADPPPPPISGATLLLSRDETRAFVSDPDRDRVFIVDTVALERLHTLALAPGQEPGRLVEDSVGLVHVATRRTGTLVTIDPDAGEIVAEHEVCANPRGLAHDPADDSILVACAEGVLARVPVEGTVSTIDVGVELRDVVDVGPPIRVSTFRTPTVLELDEDGSIVEAVSVREVGVLGDAFVDPALGDVEDVLRPNTARRVIATDDGWVALHQFASSRRVEVESDSYGDSQCRPLQSAALTRLDGGQASPVSVPIPSAAIVYDVALSDFATEAAIVGAEANGPFVALVNTHGGRTVDFGCFVDNAIRVPGEATSVELDATRRAWVQSREPAALFRIDFESQTIDEIVLTETSVADTGHQLFHVPTKGMVGCVSCHPEGRDDGVVWRFDGVGKRRTPALDVRLEGSEPFHWSGDLADMRELVEEVRTRRMDGDELTAAHADAVARWVFALAPMNPAVPNDPDAIARGEQLFADVGCVACHNGVALTNNETVEAAGFPAMQVPTLVGVRWRAPYFHDGSAPDLESAIERMLPASVSIGSEGIADLAAYLRSL